MPRTGRRQPVDYPDPTFSNFSPPSRGTAFQLLTRAGTRTVPRVPALRSDWYLPRAAEVVRRLTRLVFLADRGFFDRPKSLDRNWRPLGVGHLTMRGDRSDYLGSLPFDAVWGIANGVAAGVFKYVVLTGPRLN